MYIVIKAFVVWLIFYSINATLNGLEASNLLGGEDCAKITVAEVNLTLTETSILSKTICNIFSLLLLLVNSRI